MCLSVKKNKLAKFCKIFNFTMKKTAKEDIIVYKGLYPRNCDFKNLSGESKKQLHNSEFKGIINGIECKGKISIYLGNIYFCTNDIRLGGVSCLEKFGYKYSRVIDNNIQEIIVNDKKLTLVFDLVTPYQNMNVEIGKTYKSEFSINNCKYTINIEKGIHSFKEIDPCKEIASIVVKCRIPKGSKYYVGNFSGDKSYASDTLEYLEII